MRKLSLLMALVMLVSMAGVAASAEVTDAIMESASGFFYIEANGDQPRLSAASKDKFFQAEGLWFKDMNGNGALDVYEDWRQPADARVADLLSQMTLFEKAASLGFAGIGGMNGVIAANMNNDVVLYSEEPFTNIGVQSMDGEAVVASMTYQIKTARATTFIAAMTGLPTTSLTCSISCKPSPRRIHWALRWCSRATAPTTPGAV